MGSETEKRFLLPSMPDLGDVKPLSIVQAYLSVVPERTVRVRTMGDMAFLAVKGKRIEGTAPEFEYPVPMDDALGMLKLCGPDLTLSKDRHEWHGTDKKKWEIDRFTGRHSGLVIAELELPSLSEPFHMAAWMNGKDITNDSRFSNSNLIAVKTEDLPALIRSVLNPT